MVTKEMILLASAAAWASIVGGSITTIKHVKKQIESLREQSEAKERLRFCWDVLYSPILLKKRDEVRSIVIMPDGIPFTDKGDPSKFQSAVDAHDAIIKNIYGKSRTDILVSLFKGKDRAISGIKTTYADLKSKPQSYLSIASETSSQFGRWIFDPSKPRSLTNTLELTWMITNERKYMKDGDPKEIFRYVDGTLRPEPFQVVLDRNKPDEPIRPGYGYITCRDEGPYEDKEIALLTEDIYLWTYGPNTFYEGRISPAQSKALLISNEKGLYGPGTASKKISMESADVLERIVNEVKEIRAIDRRFQVLLMVKTKTSSGKRGEKRTGPHEVYFPGEKQCTGGGFTILKTKK